MSFFPSRVVISRTPIDDYYLLHNATLLLCCRNEKLVCRDLPQTKQEEFKVSVSEAARPFLTGRSDRFVEEVELFLASGLNIDAYDKVYIRHLGWKIPEIANDDEDDEEFQEHTPLVPYLNFFDEDDFY